MLVLLLCHSEVGVALGDPLATSDDRRISTTAGDSQGSNHGTLYTSGCKGSTYQDYCLDSTYLREFYVTAYSGYDICTYSDVECVGACTDGKCVECVSDGDCDPHPTTHVIGKCDSPDGTDNTATPGYTYECYWGTEVVPEFRTGC